MNRIFPEKLKNSLAQRLASIYYLIGQDPLLLTESRDLIVQTATNQGFDEKTHITVDTSMDWDGLIERCQSMGLFSSRQVISLTLPENLTLTIQTRLTEVINALNPDVLLIVEMPKLSKTAEKQAWIKKSVQIEPHLILVNCQTPNIEQLPRWVINRAQAMELTIDQEAIQLLCYSNENNLLALKQNLELLALLYPDHKLNFARVQTIVEQTAVFTPYQWIDALLEGKETRTRRILKGLQTEDIQPIILLRSLQRELMLLLELSKPAQRLTDLDQPLPIMQLRVGFNRLKIWENRRNLYTAAFKRLTYRKLYQLIQQLSDLERIIKQDFTSDVWSSLADLSVQMATIK